MSRRRDHIIERLEPWWKIANMSLGSFVENVEKDRCMGSIFGNQFQFLLIQGDWRMFSEDLKPRRGILSRFGLRVMSWDDSSVLKDSIGCMERNWCYGMAEMLIDSEMA